MGATSGSIECWRPATSGRLRGICKMLGLAECKVCNMPYWLYLYIFNGWFLAYVSLYPNKSSFHKCSTWLLTCTVREGTSFFFFFFNRKATHPPPGSLWSSNWASWATDSLLSLELPLASREATVAQVQLHPVLVANKLQVRQQKQDTLFWFHTWSPSCYIPSISDPCEALLQEDALILAQTVIFKRTAVGSGHRVPRGRRVPRYR